MVYIGVDVGTSAVKLLAMDEAGRVIKIVTRDYPLYMEGLCSEQAPEDWWERTADGLRELTAAIETPVGAVSFSGQMHGLVMLDADDRVLRRAILWNDQRTQKQCDYLNNEIGRDKLIAHTANIALTGFTAPKLLWVRENEPEIYARVAKVMLPKDYIAYKLSGVFATDESDASGMLLLDVKKREWSPFMLGIVGLREEQLARVYKSSEAVGGVTPEAAKLTGLSTDTLVVIGGGDQAVGAVGTGTVRGGMCSLSLGTSGVVFAANDSFSVDEGPSGIHSFCHANGRYHMMGVTLAAAGSTKWWVEDVLHSKDYAGEQVAISKARLGNNEALYLPYLSGERTPHNDTNARGAFFGMTTQTSRSDMMLAVMEGVSYSLRDILEIMQRLNVTATSARITGGGAKSPLWCEIMANVLNMRVDKINSAEGPAFGAAILAAVGAGAFGSVEEACEKFILITESFLPDAEIVKRYDARYPFYKQLYTSLKSITDSYR
jgi:xylulokinase